MNLSMKQKQNQGHREETSGCQGGGGGRGINQELGINIHTLIYIR